MYPLAPSAETGSESNKKSGFLQKVHAQPANSRLSVETFTFSPSLMKRASVVTLIKTGQRWSGQNRPTEVAGTSITSRHHSPRVFEAFWAACSSRANSSSLTFVPMDLVRRFGLTMSFCP
jgi:hypothetical protein